MLFIFDIHISIIGKQSESINKSNYSCHTKQIFFETFLFIMSLILSNVRSMIDKKHDDLVDKKWMKEYRSQ